MKVGRLCILFLYMAVTWLAAGQPGAGRGSDHERLVGAWRLLRVEVAGADGKAAEAPQPVGMLIYTRDGHVSVQLMYPKTAAGLSNEYVKNGYEASFGSYEIDETHHTITHHVVGSNTGDALVGRDLPRAYELTPEGRLVIGPVSAAEHWRAIWEHY